MIIRVENVEVGKKVNYQFRGIGKGTESAWSRNFTHTVTANHAPPGPVTDLTSEAIGDAFYTEWEKPEFKVDGQPFYDFSHYVVTYSGTTVTREYDVIVTNNYHELYFNTNKLFFDVPQANLGIKVEAVDVYGNVSAPITTTVSNPIPSAPTSVVAEQMVESIAIQWVENSIDDDVIEHRVYHMSSETESLLGKSPIFAGSGNSFVYKTLTSAIAYYGIVAVDKFGQESPLAVSNGVAPKSSTGVDLVAPPTTSITNVVDIIEGSNRLFSVEWDESVADDLAGYQIGYSTNGGSDAYVMVSGDDLSTVINSLRIGYDYELKIRPYDISGNYSSWSPVYYVNSGTVVVQPPTNVNFVGGNEDAMVYWDRATDENVKGYVVWFAKGNDPTVPSRTELKTDANIVTLTNLDPNSTYSALVYSYAYGQEDTLSDPTNIVSGDTVSLITSESNQAITGAMLANNIIDSVHIKDLAVTSAKIVSVDADKITANTAFVNDLSVESTFTIDELGQIVSSNYAEGVSGFKLDQNELIINQGKISARAIDLQVGNNIMPAVYSTFQFGDAYYEQNMDGLGSSSSIVSGGRFGGQCLRLEGANRVSLSPTNGVDFNLFLEESTEYIVSFYAKTSDGQTADIDIERWSGSGVQSETIQIDSQSWSRYSYTFTSGATNLDQHIGLVADLQSGSRVSVDGFQVEPKTSDSDSPGPFQVPSLTSIDGGMVSTGQIRSTATVTVNGVDQPAWSLNTQGGAQLGDTVVRGDMVVGDPLDNGESIIQSHSYSPGSNGWIIRSDGSAEFQNVTIGPGQVNLDNLEETVLNVSNLKAGTINVEFDMGVGGKFVSGDPNGEASEMNLEGISVYGWEDERGRFLITRLGEEFAILGDEDQIVANIDQEGGATFETVNSNQDVYIGGKALLGSKLTGEFDTESWEWQRPWGIVARNEVMNAYSDGNVPDGGEQGISQMNLSLVGGRSYKIYVVNGEYSKTNAINSFNYACFWLTYTESTNGVEPPNPTPDSKGLTEGRDYDGYTYSSYFRPIAINSFINPSVDTDIKLLLGFRAWNCTVNIVSRDRDYTFQMIVEDIGPTPDPIGIANLSGKGSTAPTTPTKKTYTSYWYPNEVKNYIGSTLSNPSGGSSKMGQGRVSGMSGPRESIARFSGTSSGNSDEAGKTITQALSGANVKKVRLRVSNTQSVNSSVSPLISYGSSFTGSFQNQVAGTKVPRGGTRTTTLTSSIHSWLTSSSANRYIKLGPGSSSAYNTYYAEFGGDSGSYSKRLMLEIEYTR